MKKIKTISPPKFATWLLHWYCRQHLLEDLEGDLNEYFERNVISKGVGRAKLIYFLDVLKFMRSYTVRRPQVQGFMNHFILYNSYYKTSFRTLRRNKLFSSINVFGLAISMCVSLLLIAFFLEVRSYDNFHKNGARIFRVNNFLRETNGNAYNYASTSVLADRKVSETIGGIHRKVSLHKGFGDDISYGSKTIPLRGFWASEDFFKLFSFDVIGGNPSTALKQPNSIVLTESAAHKIFDNDDAIGKIVRVDTADFTVTLVIKDIPKNSHLQFDMLGSYITLDNYMSIKSEERLQWDNMWNHYVYVQLAETRNPEDFQNDLDKISRENNNVHQPNIKLYGEPLGEIALSSNMSNSIGPTIDRSTFSLLGTLCVVVMISACFNYTNLSIARALRRLREIGIRKSIGASRRQVFLQFICEALILSMLALCAAFIFFLVIRKEFISLNIRYQEMLTLKLTWDLVGWSIVLAVGVGLVAGSFPASVFSKLNSAVVLKDSSGVTLFKHVNLRKGLIVFQYTLSILFIVLVSIGYRQYRYSLSFDLGFKTDNILAIDLQGNNPIPIINELSSLQEVRRQALTSFVASTGISESESVKYQDPHDSVELHYNYVDANYIPLHEHRLIAGENFNSQSAVEELKLQLIVNKHILAWMKIEDPHDAIGEQLKLGGREYTIIGVVEDFHHERVNYPIENFAFRHDPTRFSVLNVQIESGDIVATMNKIESIWKKVDDVHPLEAKFYSEHITHAYEKLSWIIKIIAFLAFLAIIIAFLGLLGMVIFTTETKIKEISIRKVLGASVPNLIILMGKGFVWLLTISTAIAVPLGYLLMDRVIFGKVVYRAPLGVLDVGLGAFVVISVAIAMIVSQTWNVAKTNPAEVLKNE